MKKMILVIIGTLLALGVLPSEQAVAEIFFDTPDPFVAPGETISVEIFSTVITDHIRMDRISDDGNGSASNLFVNPDYNPPLNAGVPINESGILIEWVSTGIMPDSPEVSGSLYNFDYTVSLGAVDGQLISIFADPSGGAINQIYANIPTGWEYVTPESLTLTIIPEPATFFLLGGGLLLVRRIRQKPG
jgi:hypothetical protein